MNKELKLRRPIAFLLALILIISVFPVFPGSSGLVSQVYAEGEGEDETPPSGTEGEGLSYNVKDLLRYDQGSVEPNFDYVVDTSKLVVKEENVDISHGPSFSYKYQQRWNNNAWYSRTEVDTNALTYNNSLGRYIHKARVAQDCVVWSGNVKAQTINSSNDEYVDIRFPDAAKNVRTGERKDVIIRISNVQIAGGWNLANGNPATSSNSTSATAILVCNYTYAERQTYYMNSEYYYNDDDELEVNGSLMLTNFIEYEEFENDTLWAGRPSNAVSYDIEVIVDGAGANETCYARYGDIDTYYRPVYYGMSEGALGYSGDTDLNKELLDEVYKNDFNWGQLTAEEYTNALNYWRNHEVTSGHWIKNFPEALPLYVETVNVLDGIVSPVYVTDTARLWKVKDALGVYRTFAAGDNDASTDITAINFIGRATGYKIQWRGPSCATRLLDPPFPSIVLRKTAEDGNVSGITFDFYKKGASGYPNTPTFTATTDADGYIRLTGDSGRAYLESTQNFTYNEYLEFAATYKVVERVPAGYIVAGGSNTKEITLTVGDNLIEFENVLSPTNVNVQKTFPAGITATADMLSGWTFTLEELNSIEAQRSGNTLWIRNSAVLDGGNKAIVRIEGHRDVNGVDTVVSEFTPDQCRIISSSDAGWQNTYSSYSAYAQFASGILQDGTTYIVYYKTPGRTTLTRTTGSDGKAEFNNLENGKLWWLSETPRAGYVEKPGVFVNPASRTTTTIEMENVPLTTIRIKKEIPPPSEGDVSGWSFSLEKYDDYVADGNQFTTYITKNAIRYTGGREIYITGVTDAYNITVKRGNTVITGWEKVYNTSSTPGLHLRGINGAAVFATAGTYTITYTTRERWDATTDANGYCEFTVPANTSLWLVERAQQGWVELDGMQIDPVPYNNGSYVGVYAANSITVNNYETTGWLRVIKNFETGCEGTNNAGWQFIACRAGKYTGNWFATQTYLAPASGTVTFSAGDVYKIYDGTSELSGWSRSGNTINLGYGSNASRNQGHFITVVYATDNAPTDYRNSILTTDSSGSATAELLVGSTVVEEIPRPGYISQATHTVFIEEDSVTSTTFTNNQMQLEITKLLSDPLIGSVRGWQFLVCTSNPDTDNSAYAMYAVTSDVSGKALITGLPAGTYWVKEVAVEGWNAQSAVMVTVTESNVVGNPATVTITNSLSSGTLDLIKTDTSETGNVSNIPFVIIPKSLVGSATHLFGKAKYIATSDTTTVSFSGTSYGIVAVYVNGRSVSFNQTSVRSATVNETIYSGNKVEIVYKKTNVDYSGYVHYTDSEGHITMSLSGGTYFIEEIPQPGYSVLPAQTVTVGGNETTTVTFENAPESEQASLKIVKEFAEGTEGNLQGWKFAVIPIDSAPTAANRPIFRTTTVTTGWQTFVTIQGATRIIGVYKDGEPFECTTSGGRINLPLGTPEGTILYVIYATRNVAASQTYTTNSSGFITKFGITPGEYYIEEIPQYGYKVNDPRNLNYKIVTVEAGELTTVTFVNKSIPTSFQVTKALETGAEGTVEGWVFHLQKAGQTGVAQSARSHMTVQDVPLAAGDVLFIKYPDGTYVPKDLYEIIRITVGRTKTIEIEFLCEDDEMVPGLYVVGYTLSDEILTQTTNRRGVATFTNLEPGASYWLTEDTVYGWLPYEGAFVTPVRCNDTQYTGAYAANAITVTNYPNVGTLALTKTVTPLNAASLEGWQFVAKPVESGQSVPKWFAMSTWIANGTTRLHALDNNVAQEVYAVYANGVQLAENTDYTVEGLAVQFATAPIDGTVITVVHTTPDAVQLKDMLIHTTDAAGTISDDILAGEYMVEEIPVPGFAVQDDVSATIVRSETTSVQFANKQLTIRVQKIVESTVPAGSVYAEDDPTVWTLELYAKDPALNPNAVPIKTATAAANGGYAFFRGIPAGRYWVKEISQDGWKVISTVEVTVSDRHTSSAPARVVLTNYPLVLELTKVLPDAADIVGTPWSNVTPSLEGWEFTVYKTNPDTDDQAEAVATVTTNAQGKAYVARIPAGTYWIKETSVTGWKTPAAVQVTVTNNNTAENPATVSVENMPLKLVITKQIATGVTGSVEGWEFKIYDTNPETTENATPIKTVTTNANGTIEFTYIPAGMYWIAETAVSGWGTVPVVQITITNDHTIYNPANVIVVNDPLELKIIKEIANGAEGSVQGWEFTVYAEDPDLNDNATPYAVLTSGSNGEAVKTHIEAGTYWVKETPVPGWKIQPTKVITVTNENTTANPAEVYFENIPLELVIRKELNISDGTSATLEGWEFKVYDENPTTNPSAAPIATLTSNELGQAEYIGLAAGMYWVKETNVTNWAEQAVAEVTVSDENTISNPAVVTITNTTLPTSLRAKKLIAEGNTGSVEGWTFFLQPYADYQANGVFVENTAAVTMAAAGTTMTLGSELNAKKVFSVEAADGTVYTNFSTATDLETGNTVITLAESIPAGNYTVHYTNRENIFMATSDADGYAYFNNLPADVTDYWLSEVQEEHWLPFGGLRVTVTPYNNGTYTGTFSTNSVEVTNTRDSGAVTVTKQFGTGSTGSLEGWQFSVRPTSESQASEKWFTKTTIIADGGSTYTYQTSNTGEPYRVYVNGVAVTPASASNGSLTMASDVPSGSIITIVDYTAAGAGKTSTIYTTTSTGVISTDLDSGSYVIEEIPMPGYIATNVQTVTVSHGNNASVTFVNQQMLFQVVKELAEGSEGDVAGWEFGIYATNPDTDENATLLGTITTNASGIALSSNASGLVLEPGTYWVKETAVSGWAVLPAASVTVTEENTPDNPASVTFTNEQSTGHIEIQKDYVEGSDGPLNGWEFALLPQSAKTFDGSIFGTFSFVFTNTSYVDNTDGYYTFTVSRFSDEEISGVYKAYCNGVLCEDASLGMSASQFKVKHNFQPGDLVMIVYMRNVTVTPSDYNVIITDVTGHAEADVELGGLYVEEIPRPGYIQQPGTTVTIAGETVSLTFENEAEKPGAVTILKENTSGTKISGVGMRLEYSYDNGATWNPIRTASAGEATSSNPYPIGTCTNASVTDGVLETNNSGLVTFTGLNAGYGIKYRVVEAYVPSGLSLLKDPVLLGEIPEIKTFASEDELTDFVEAYGRKNPNAAELVIDNESLTVYIYHLYAHMVNMGVSYPPTGGNGVSYIPLAFIALALACLAGVCIKKRRKVLD